jgi:hypothetical protein
MSLRDIFGGQLPAFTLSRPKEPFWQLFSDSGSSLSDHLGAIGYFRLTAKHQSTFACDTSDA